MNYILIMRSDEPLVNTFLLTSLKVDPFDVSAGFSLNRIKALLPFG